MEERLPRMELCGKFCCCEDKWTIPKKDRMSTPHKDRTLDLKKFNLG